VLLPGLSRRAMLSKLLFGIPVVAGAQEIMRAQTGGVTAGGKAIVCENGSTVKCPNKHDTCRYIDAPIAVGNDSYQNPEVAQIRQFRMLWCQQCGALFAEKTS
jgi:hypothetical protein